MPLSFPGWDLSHAFEGPSRPDRPAPYSHNDRPDIGIPQESTATVCAETFGRRGSSFSDD
jgi:hypothetical protein